VTELLKTDRFARWLDALRDVRARARVQARIERLAAGNAGDVAAVGEGVQKCGSTMAPDTESTSRNAGVTW
jgi:putative addiction module killer protein